MKNIILVTGGVGFIGSNLIELLLKKTKKTIISFDNYSTGSKKNHIKNSRVKYFKGNTVDINNLLKLRKKLSKWMFKDKLFGHLLNSGLPKGFD